MIEPNNDEVICPECCHQFRAIPVNVQHELRAANERIRDLERESEAYAQLQARCFDQGGNSVFDEVRVLRDELAAEREVSGKLLTALKVARQWIGDGEFSDGLHPDYWTPEYKSAVSMVDAAIRAKSTRNRPSEVPVSSGTTHEPQ